MTRGQNSLRDAVRAIWNEFDPIGVAGSGIQDEYDHYLAHTETLIREGADSYKFREYLEACVHTRMGMTPNDWNRDRIARYADRFAALAQSRGALR